MKKHYGHKNDGEYEIMGAALNEEEDIIEEKELKFKNIELISDFEGPFPVSTIIKNINQIFLIEIPSVIEETKNFEEIKLKEYYEENKSAIYSVLRIENEKNFLKMITTMREIDCDLRNEYESCEFFKEDYLKFKFSYTNGESIDVKLIGKNSNLFNLEF